MRRAGFMRSTPSRLGVSGLAIAGVVALATSVRSEDLPILDLPTVQQRCRPEIERYCPSAPTSESEALDCLAPHRGELSGECRGGLVSRSIRRWAWRDVCRVDLSRFCLFVQHRDRAALKCLSDEAWRLDPLCRTRLVVAAVWARRIMDRLE